MNIIDQLKDGTQIQKDSSEDYSIDRKSLTCLLEEKPENEVKII